jgi:hypothetical protein
MLMWDKNKGNPNYEHKDYSSWPFHYNVKKKFEKDSKYYLTILDGRKIPLPMDGSLLQTYVQFTLLLQAPGPR